MSTGEANTNLQPLFANPIVEQILFPPAYSDHTNLVWRVRTAREEAIVRMPRAIGELNSPFWWGCHHLFGSDPRRPAALVAVNALLADLSPIPVPRVLRTGSIGAHPGIVVEALPGTRLANFNDLPLATIEALGTAIARIHARRFSRWGAPGGDPHHPLDTFHRNLAATLRGLVARFFADNAPLAGALDEMCALAQRLPPPTDAALVMIDVDGTQFLTDGTNLTGMVDTDAYVIAPPALDLIGYEYELDRPRAAAFANGYRAILPLPDLRAVRPLYRYLYRLLEVQGSVDLNIWLGWPRHFDE